MKGTLYPIPGTWASRSEDSQICGFRGTFDKFPSTADNGFSERGETAGHVSDLQELCDQPREAGHSAVLLPTEGAPAKEAMDIGMALPP